MRQCAASSGVPVVRRRKLTVGSSSTSAPMPLKRAATNSRACSGARVTTMRFPASGLSVASSFCPPTFPRGAESVRARLDQRLPELLADALRRRPAAPLLVAQTNRCPSAESTQASSRSSPSFRRAHAPSGTWQPPSSSCSSARSAVDASARFRVVERGDDRRRLAIVRARFDSERALPHRGQHQLRRTEFR